MAMLWQYNDNTDDNSDNGWSELVGRVTQQRGRQYPPNAFTSDAQSARTFVRTTTFINPLFSKSSAQNIFTPDKVGTTHIKYCIIFVWDFKSTMHCWAESGHYYFCFFAFVFVLLSSIWPLLFWLFCSGLSYGGACNGGVEGIGTNTQLSLSLFKTKQNKTNKKQKNNNKTTINKLILWTKHSALSQKGD